MKIFPALKLNLEVDRNFHGKQFRFAFAGTGNENIYLLPDGQEVYISRSVRELISPDEFHWCNLDGKNFDLLLQEIDHAPNDKKMVPVKRIGKGPSEKSAKYDVDVIQKVKTNETQGAMGQRVHTIEFTLPVSQIEDMGEGQLAAPLWLIIEKLNAKKSSAWGIKHRTQNGVVSEFVPAPLNSKKCHPKSEQFKVWLATQREALLADKAAMEKEKQSQGDLQRELKEEQEQKLAPFVNEILSLLDGTPPSMPLVYKILKQKFPEIYENFSERKQVVTLTLKRNREL